MLPVFQLAEATSSRLLMMAKEAAEVANKRADHEIELREVMAADVGFFVPNF